MYIDEVGVLRFDGLCCPGRHRYYSPLRLPDGCPSLPTTVIDALASQSRSPGATEALSSSHDTLLAVPRSLRRRILGHPLQVPRCRPWPSPKLDGLGFLLASHREGILTTLQASLDVADRSVARPLSETVFLRFDAGISPDAGSAATGDPGVSPGRTSIGWLP